MNPNEHLSAGSQVPSASPPRRHGEGLGERTPYASMPVSTGTSEVQKAQRLAFIGMLLRQ